MERKSNLTINAEVIEQMATIAAKEVEGVAGLAENGIDLKNVLNRGKIFKPVHVTEKNGAVALDIHIKVYESANAKTVAENVQKSVKEKLQNMTGNAITRVDVTVADVAEDLK
ncbi:MAG: Asp23/Gls24 family envelope stress response protein [Acutalibacteraceae bacterium]|nr:Asp23/Gls24 family envelope stress response protein [Acutalibacteraceae bacterium]